MLINQTNKLSRWIGIFDNANVFSLRLNSGLAVNLPQLS